jgi:hypothetical protein
VHSSEAAQRADPRYINRTKLISATAALALSAAPAAGALVAAPDQNHGLSGTAPYDAGLYTAYCPAPRARRHARPSGQQEESSSQPAVEPDGGQGVEASSPTASAGPTAAAASTSEAGWPAKECLKMDKGQAGRSHTLVGLNGVHNWLLGGYGDDTIIGGNRGDVIWADYHPSGQPRTQTATIRAGNGRNVIYANDTHNFVWTGTNARTVVHAHVSGIAGVIHCQSPGVVVYLSTVSQRHFKLDGCRRISHYSVGY